MSAKWERPLLFRLVPAKWWDYHSPVTAQERKDLARIASGRPYRAHLLPRLSKPMWKLFDAFTPERPLESHFWAAVLRALAVEVHRCRRMPGHWTVAQWKTFVANADIAHSHGFMLVSYLVGGLSVDDASGGISRRLPAMARMVFGKEYAVAEERIIDTIHRLGYTNHGGWMNKAHRHRFALFVLRKRTLEPLEDDVDRLRALFDESLRRAPTWRTSAFALWWGLHALEQVEVAPPMQRRPHRTAAEPRNAWEQDVATWFSRQATQGPLTARVHAIHMRAVGRWVEQNEPRISRVADLDVEACDRIVNAISSARFGMFGRRDPNTNKKRGRALAATTKASLLRSVRMMVREYPRMGLAPISIRALLDSLVLPRHIHLQTTKSEPRDIDDLVYAKLLGALSDLAQKDIGNKYPLSMVKAVGAMLLFSGLRSDELRRLSCDCFAERKSEFEDIVTLRVPANKTSPAFEKPVPIEVADAVRAWLLERPDMQRALEDRKTEMLVDALFVFRGRRVGLAYLNETLLPLLCRKAGIEQRDSTGRITSHRCRSTMATLLGNSAEPMSLIALQAWLGHSSPRSTMRYVRVKFHALERGYHRAMAGVGAQVPGFVDLIGSVDRAADGARAGRILYTDLGDGQGLCAQDAPLACPHAMDCPGCNFHVAEDEPLVRRLRRRDHAVAVLQQFALSPAEAQALRQRQKAEKGSLLDVPTPDGRTPRQIAAERRAR